MHLASLTATLDPAAWSEGVTRLVPRWPGPSAPLAEFVGGNIAQARPEPHCSLAPARLCFSGWLGETPTQTTPLHWTPTARRTLGAACGALATSPASVFLIPHHAHLLSDLPGCVAHATAARDAAISGQPFVGMALAPTALLAPSMLSHAMDHLERIISTVAPLAPFVLMEPLCNAEVDGAALGALLRQHMPAESTLVLAGDAAEVCRWLALAPP